MTWAHDHVQVEDLQLKKHVAKVNLKRKAETTSGHISLREFFHEEVKQYDEAKGQLTFAMMEATLRKRRKRIYPTLPSSAIASIELLENMEDATFNRYYMGYVRVGDECLIFMSPKVITSLSTLVQRPQFMSRPWYGHGSICRR